MAQKMYHIRVPLDYIIGHLRGAYLEGDVSCTEEELEEIKNDPEKVRMLDLDIVDVDFSIEDIGDPDVSSIDITEKF